MLSASLSLKCRGLLCNQPTHLRSRVKISIVTLSFNQHAYLQEAMDSVLSQAYPDLEYIVVDPGSTDGSRELISSYGERIAHVIFESDRGAADGLNKGFGRATGDVYGFLNADDLLYPGSLNRVAEFFEQNPDSDMAIGNGYTIDGQGQRIRHYKARNFSVPSYFYGGAQWLQQSTFFRAEVYRRSPGFNLENRTCWDGELFVNIANNGARIGYIRADLAGFRIHEASISGSGRMNEQYQKDSRRIFRQVIGHDWTPNDEVLRFFYRARGFLKDRLHSLTMKGNR
jgi:glycosyltransferase involved in cell wall biosynthesis